MKRSSGLAVALVCAMPLSTTAQQPAPAGPFDGKYSGDMKCFPAGSYRYTGTMIRNGKFSFSLSIRNQPMRCNLELKPDGSFDNQTCEMPMSGKVSGDKLEFKARHPNGMCDVSATREKT